MLETLPHLDRSRPSKMTINRRNVAVPALQVLDEVFARFAFGALQATKRRKERRGGREGGRKEEREERREEGRKGKGAESERVREGETERRTEGRISAVSNGELGRTRQRYARPLHSYSRAFPNPSSRGVYRPEARPSVSFRRLLPGLG